MSNDMGSEMELEINYNLFAQIDVQMKNLVVAAATFPTIRNFTPIPKLYALIIPTRNYKLPFLSKLRKCPESFHLVREIRQVAEGEKEITYTQDTAAECPPTV